MAGPQQQTKRGAEAEAQPAPGAKRATQEPEQQKDIQDGGAAVQQPASDTTNHEVQTATKQKETQPAGGDLKPVEHATLVSSKEGDDGAHDDSAQARVQQLVTEAAKAQDKLEQAVKEVTEKQKEAVKASEEVLKEAVAANATTKEESVTSKETSQDDKIQVPQESVQNGASQTPLTKPADEDANKTGKEVKEINTLGETKTVPEKVIEALPANESVPPQAEAPQSGQFTDSNLAFNASNPLPQVVIPPVVNGEGNLAPQLHAQNLAAAQAPFVPAMATPLLAEIRTTPLSKPGEDNGPAPMQEG
ncbi:unnamed protein product [Sphagnum compactum]